MIIATRRDAFVVLATDRFEPSYDLMHEDTDPKVLLHPTLPLAVAVVGMLTVPDPRSGREQSTKAFVERIIHEINQPTELAFERITQRIANRLQPAVRQALRNARVAPEHPSVDILIASVRGTTAGMGLQRVGERVESQELQRHLDAPPDLQGYFKSGQHADPAALYGDRLTDAEFVANHLRRVMTGAIAQEATMSGGKNKAVGTAVDVVVITGKGAKLAR